MRPPLLARLPAPLSRRTPQKSESFCGWRCGPPCPHTLPQPRSAVACAAWPGRTLGRTSLILAVFVQILCDLRSIRFQISPDYSPSHEFGYIREEAAIWRDHLSFYHSLPSNPNHTLIPKWIEGAKDRRTWRTSRKLARKNWGVTWELVYSISPVIYLNFTCMDALISIMDVIVFAPMRG
jgi:hypothetical protein